MIKGLTSHFILHDDRNLIKAYLSKDVSKDADSWALGFNAFGISIPKELILEVFDFHKSHNNEFSALVEKYPFAQLVFSQWLTIKLYERHKERTKNDNLDYDNFLKNFT